MQDERSFLSEACGALEAMAYDGVHLDGDRLERYVRAVITEYDRRGEVEKAAATYISAPIIKRDDWAISPEYQRLCALVRRK